MIEAKLSNRSILRLSNEVLWQVITYYSYHIKTHKKRFMEFIFSLQ